MVLHSFVHGVPSFLWQPSWEFGFSVVIGVLRVNVPFGKSALFEGIVGPQIHVVKLVGQ